MNLGITADDMYEFLGGRVAKRDSYPFVYPARKELMRDQVHARSVSGSYIKWDTKKPSRSSSASSAGRARRSRHSAGVRL